MALWKRNPQNSPSRDNAAENTDTKTEIARSGTGDVKNIIAIASGKGGVGKSTVAANLALALQAQGARVGLLDADIYGPSQPGLLGAAGEEPGVLNGQFQPISKYGVKFISMGSLLGDDGPVIWRAPMAMKMIQQFLGNVVWGDLDYLLIDLPPGTGDVQLTLAQQASLSGAVIVTTPQQIALGVAKKGLKMFEQVNVPIIGIIENMSGFTCKHCGQETAIFAKGGGEQMARELDIAYLGSIPLDPEIMSSGENGVPILANGAKLSAGKAYMDLAVNVQNRIAELQSSSNVLEPVDISSSPEGNLLIRWPDGHEGFHTPYHLRLNCRCAVCIDENSGRRKLDEKTVPLDIKMKSTAPVGRYAISINFTDGHNTGIFAFKRLRDLCECEICAGKSAQNSFEV